MTKNLRLIISSVLFVFFLFSCQDDLYEHAIKEPARTLKIERFSMKNATPVKHAALLKSTNEIAETLIVPLNTEKLSIRMVYDSILGIEYDDEKGIHIQNGDYESYTFPIRNYEANEKVRNLIFSSKTGGDFDVYIYSYDFTKEELSIITEAQLLSKSVTTNKIEEGRVKPPSIVCLEIYIWNPGPYPNCGPECGNHSASGEPCQSTGQWILDSSVCGWIGGEGNNSGTGNPESSNSGNNGSDGGGGDNGGGGTNGTGPPPSGYNGQNPAIHGTQGPIITAPIFEEEPPNPCQLISVLKSDDVFKQKMVALKNAAQQWSRELLFTVYDDPNPNSQVSQTDNYNYFEFMGTVNNPSASWTGNQTMKGMIHSHYNGLLSVFFTSGFKTVV